MNPGLAGIFTTLLDRTIDEFPEEELDHVEYLRVEAETLAKQLSLMACGLEAMTHQQQGTEEIVGSQALAPTFAIISHVAENIGAMLEALEMAGDVRLRRQPAASAQAGRPARASRIMSKPQVASIADGGAA